MRRRGVHAANGPVRYTRVGPVGDAMPFGKTIPRDTAAVANGILAGQIDHAVLLRRGVLVRARDGGGAVERIEDVERPEWDADLRVPIRTVRVDPDEAPILRFVVMARRIDYGKRAARFVPARMLHDGVDGCRAFAAALPERVAGHLAGCVHPSITISAPMDADLQDPPEILARMLQLYREGYDVVSPRSGVRRGKACGGIIPEAARTLQTRTHR